jgi:hypothetical protein
VQERETLVGEDEGIKERGTEKTSIAGIYIMGKRKREQEQRRTERR